MRQFVNRLFRLEPDEWPKLLQFGLFGFLLQTGMGIGFSAGDAAFLSNVGAGSLPVIFLLTPVVMLFYTAVFSYLMVRFSIGFIVNFTLALLIAGGATLWALIDIGLPLDWQPVVYFAIKLYLAVWYIGLYTLFWNFTDSYFDIQDAKRLFPLFAAFCAFGTATGALLVSVLAGSIPMHYLFLLWSLIAFATAPVARFLQRRWTQIAESDLVGVGQPSSTLDKFAGVGRAFKGSRFAMVMALTLFVTLLMTNLAEFQYSTVLQEGRSEAELAALLGALYAAANVFNMLVCLFVFNRLVARIGVRNVALIQPLTYFAVFGYFFLEGSTAAALAAFFAYHGVLTSIQYNNENLLFNAVPSHVKRPLRTVIEGMCEPLASLVAGGFLLYWADLLDVRELSGIGIIISFGLIAIVFALRQQYPAAMAANMQRGWLNFGGRNSNRLTFDGDALQQLEAAAEEDQTHKGAVANRLLMAQYKAATETQQTDDLDSLAKDLLKEGGERAGALASLGRLAGPDDVHLFGPIARALPQLSADERNAAIRIIGQISDTEMIPDILEVSADLAPRDRRAMAGVLVEMGETAIPHLVRAIGAEKKAYPFRLLAAHALSQLSYAQYASQLDRLVQAELKNTDRVLQTASLFDAQPDPTGTFALIARAQRERVEAAVDFALELLSLGKKLPDADLLIVSLHSSNTKVRGNAIESIENGVDQWTYKLIRPLLRAQEGKPDQRTEEHVEKALFEIASEARPIEAAIAIEALSEITSKPRLLRRIQPILSQPLRPLLRDVIGGIYGTRNSKMPAILSVLRTLSLSPRLGAAPLQSLLPLAQNADLIKPQDPAHSERVDGTAVWISEADIQAVAARHPALALVLFKAANGERDAA